MTTAEKTLVVDAYVRLNGKIGRDIIFDGCIVELWLAGPPAIIASCEFVDCLLIGDGWPENAYL